MSRGQKNGDEVSQRQDSSLGERRCGFGEVPPTSFDAKSHSNDSALDGAYCEVPLERNDVNMWRQNKKEERKGVEKRNKGGTRTTGYAATCHCCRKLV